MLPIISYRKIWFILSGSAVLASALALLFWGLLPGVDFSGGSLMEVSAPGDITKDMLKERLEPLGLGDVVIQTTNEGGYLLRFAEVSEEKHQEVIQALAVTEKRFTSIGPSIGKALREKAWYAIAVVLLMIIAYIAWTFRKVSWPVPSWKYGIIAIVALFHDIVIVMGVFAVLGRWYMVEVNASFVVALLTILGYSVNDTIVIFDRIRENLPKMKGTFAEIVNASMNETLLRSLYTSLTTIFALLTIYYFGGESTRYFVLALIIGIIVGTYSSIFLASPLLVFLHKLAKK